MQAAAVLAFLAVGVAALLYLNAFTHSGENFYYLEWSDASVVSADGAETAFDPLGIPLRWRKGNTTALPPPCRSARVRTIWFSRLPAWI